MEDKYIGFTILDLMELKSRADEISGNWNGKTERGEEQAQLMNEISGNCNELIRLLKEINL